ncbi:caspase family protein [Azospirillum canadense]|uniref:caspase family protein n=1 Tax=Azospirillum canadense TaxID=403962 RepID=UPI002226F707|nr:caspase family protein [Azospirillum canadense]MCW2240563.1 hypothetical protein [Azospirillum canadense]
MARVFERMTLDDFADMLNQFRFRRRINAVHMHHTWRPSHAQYRGHETIVAMWRYHTQEQGWSDIAQHLTIAPDGTIWLGRNWNLPPASASGHNGNTEAGPFMFEMIGDFDVGQDPFDDPQRSVALEVIARVQQRFGLPPETLRFHNQMSSKSCPGGAIDYQETVAAVRGIHTRLKKEATDSARSAARGGPFGQDASRLVEILRRFETEAPAFHDPPNAEPREDQSMVRVLETRQDLGARDLAALRPHVINLVQGRFSDDGRFTTAQGDVDAIVDQHLVAALVAARARQDKLRIVIYAHGGLVSERNALAMAHAQLGWWRRNHVYPLFFVWETGLFESIGQLLARSRSAVRDRGARDLADYTSDPLIEAAARALGGPLIWSGMKRSAERASDAQGGASYAAARLAAFCQANPEDVELHAVGHSAGAIFHAHFLPACLDLGTPTFRTVSFLAPALRIDAFQQRLAPLVGGGIEHLGIFTMRKDLELDDSCAQLYRKSLLYLIHYALEPEGRTPILGLEASLRADPALRALLGLSGTAVSAADVVWSITEETSGPNASLATTHGGFANDAATMNSVLRRVLDRPVGAIDEFPPEAQERGAPDWQEQVDWPEEMQFGKTAGWPSPRPPAGGIMPAPGAAAPVTSPLVAAGPVAAGARRALCVGIDRYLTSPLYGCVADAKLWARTLQALGFEATLLLDSQATRQGILRALGWLIDTSRPGDVLVFQYSGHGTQLPDLDGDEAGGDSAAQDEALCPIDYPTGAFVIDDDIGAIFGRIPAGVNVTSFIDCCHSGTISRFGVGPGLSGHTGAGDRPRFVIATPEMVEAHRRYRQIGERRSTPTGVRGRDTMREVLFAACLSTEMAYESAGQGDFTLRATRLLAGGDAGLSNEDFQHRVTEAFGPVARQHPGLYCTAEARARPLLGDIGDAAGASVLGSRSRWGLGIVPEFYAPAGSSMELGMPKSMFGSPFAEKLRVERADNLVSAFAGSTPPQSWYEDSPTTEPLSEAQAEREYHSRAGYGAPPLDRAEVTVRIQRIEEAIGDSLTAPQAGGAAPKTEPVPEAERHIGIWLSERPEGLSEPLRVNEIYTLNFKVGRPVEGSLVGGSDTEVPFSDVPPGGLATEWVIASQTVEFMAGTPGTSVTTSLLERATAWTARFPLLIPEKGDSFIPQLQIRPRAAEAARFDVVVYAHREIYRQFTVRLAIADSAVAPNTVAVSVQDDLLYSPIAHLNLGKPHEWTTPPGELVVTVIGSMASVRGDVGSQFVDDVTFWSGVQAKVAGNIQNVRAAAERFRARWEADLNDIDPDDLANRLRNWTPEYNWAMLRDHADDDHRRRWDDTLRVSQELRDLAFDGHRLYEAFFPAGSNLRSWIDALSPGHRLDISWKPQEGWIPHVPWGLMYLPDVPAPGQSIDPMGFLALRFRLGYTAHAVQAGSKALGGLQDTHRAHFLYWGDDPKDATGQESRWQQQQWAAWSNQVFVPTTPRGLDPKAELVQLLNEPKPTPVSVLYLFCQCNVGDGNDPILRFGGTAQLTDMVRRTELGTKLLADRPLVFANACTTAASDPYIANLLEEAFFARGCRAYLGTETKVPIQFASRFASIFFHFFYRIADPEKAPLAAGEAVAQTRLFLWTHYRNFGGLFYTYVNQYELFMARDAEVLALRAPR